MELQNICYTRFSDFVTRCLVEYGKIGDKSGHFPAVFTSETAVMSEAEVEEVAAAELETA